MKKFLWTIITVLLKAAALAALVFLGAVCTAISRDLAVYFSVALVILSSFAIFRPLPTIWLSGRGFSASVLVTGLLLVAVTTSNRSDTRLADLKASDPVAYLAALKTDDEAKWLAELKVMDPKRYEVEMAKVAIEKAAERARLLEEDTKKRQALVAQRKAELAAKTEEECGQGKAEDAYYYSQPFVERGLKAPATAEFPYASEVSARALGDCMFQVEAYVDAQNSFGAMLRTRYSAILRRLPEKESWQLITLHFAD